MGLYSDLGDYIEEGGRDEQLPDKNVKNEGNIPQGDPDVSGGRKGNIPTSDPQPNEPSQDGNIQSNDARPEEPNQRQNIDPRQQDVDESQLRGNIPSSDKTPDPPQRRGNIQPRQFNEERGEFQRDIDPQEENRPQDARQTGNIDSKDSRPQSPNRDQIDARPESRPQNVENRGREAREDATPDQVNQRNLEAREGAAPDQVTNQASREAKEEAQPQSPTRRNVIRLKDEAAPDQPSQRGNISQTDESEPPEPNRRGSIQGTEESEPSEPNRKNNIQTPREEDPEPQEPNRRGNIRSPREEDPEPQEPQREGNIQAPREEDPEPQEPQREGNIRSPREEDPEPQSPDLDGNIEAEDERPPGVRNEGNIQSEDVRPQNANQRGNIQSEDSRPREPNQRGNIKPTEEPPSTEPAEDADIEITGDPSAADEESAANIPVEDNPPPEPDQEGNIQSEDSRPQEPDRDGSIQSEDVRPQEPEHDDSIEAEDSRPQEPDQDGAIDSEDARPQEVDNDNFIEPEDNPPEGVNPEESIEPEDNPPDDVDQDSFIEPEDNRPSEVDPDEFIDPRDGETTDGIGGQNPEGPAQTGNINPGDAQNTDGVGGEFPDSEDGVPEWEEERTAQTQVSGDLGEANEPIRLAEFESFGSSRNTEQPGSPLARSGFLSLPNFGTDEPFILRRPEAGGGSSFIANIKQKDTRTTPVASAAEDTIRISKFFASGKGITYNLKQQFLQSQNPRSRTRIYDPTAPIQASASGMAVRPGQGITRHLGADSGPAGIVGDAADAIGDELGFDVPSSSRYEDEINDESINTEWGEMRGSLFWLSPVATEALPEVTGSQAKLTVQQRLSENIPNIKQLSSTKSNEELAGFAASVLAGNGGIDDGYLFTKTYDPKGGQDSEGVQLTDNYHHEFPFISNPGFVNSRASPTALSYVEPQFASTYTELLQKTQDERDSQGSYFPYANPEGSPVTDDVTDGDGNVISQRQNDTTSEVYYENRAFGDDEDDIPLHRGVPGQEESRGMPNYSRTNEEGRKIKRIDWINRLEPIVGENVDPEQETFGEGQHKDLVPFKFFDIENRALIVFRAFVESISDNLSPQWSQKDYSGRPEQAHIYSGYENTISFSFQAVPFSLEEFKAIWKKVNYLKGLTTPANYSSASGGGAYMVPPQMRLTIGDMFNHVHGYINSLTISVNDDMPWELRETEGRLPQAVEIDVDWQVIENRGRPPKAGQKFYDAPFIDEVEEAVQASPEPQEEILPESQDQVLEQEPTEEPRAISQSRQAP